MFYSRLRRRQQVCDRIAADCLATAASRCAVASCVLRRQMFRSLKQCVKQSCPPQEEQQGDMLLFINSNAFSPHRRGRAALFLSLREEVELNSLRYMWHLALCHLSMFVGVCLCVCVYTHRDGLYSHPSGKDAFEVIQLWPLSNARPFLFWNDISVINAPLLCMCFLQNDDLSDVSSSHICVLFSNSLVLSQLFVSKLSIKH